MHGSEIRRHTKEEVLSEMHPVIREWFDSKFDELTEPQSYAIPVIHRKKSVLISSPTGSGKTITAFLSIINNLFEMGEKGTLEDRIYCVYISPLKALANDIHRNLEVPLQEIYELAKKKGLKVPRIRTAIRSGDTSQRERQRMSRKPPHIFITTPESLSLVLTSPKFRERFRDVRYVIVDEIHEISGSKRGSMLSINLERLQNLAGHLIRIGLSATQAPIEEISRFLGGFSGSRPRKVEIIEINTKREMDLKVLSPVKDLNSVPFEVSRERAYDMIADMIGRHRTTLVFTNTRSATETVAYKLKERGVSDIEAHHGSMSKERRLDVEEKLKKGELKAVITSTSLELGIDIGYVDLVIQIGSPKSIAKGLQRIGRSGHAIGGVPKGRFIGFQNDDLIECAVLVKSAYEGFIDRVDIPKNPLDVLAQTIVGMSLEERWKADDALALIRRSYSFHTLRKSDFLSVMDYLSGKSEDFYSKIWYDREEGIFGKKRGARLIYFLNSGTIPEDSNYTVLSESGASLGKLSERFVERLSPGDIFVLGGRSYEFVRVRGMKLYVRDARGKSPTVPSWAGEMLPRSFDLSIEVGKFRRRMAELLQKGDPNILSILSEEYHLEDMAASSIYRYIEEQRESCGIIPDHHRLLVEEYRSGEKWHYIFHFPYGRRVNDAVSRALSYRISRLMKVSISVTVDDDSFLITSGHRIENPSVRLLSSSSIEGVLKESIRDTEMFSQRFRHCATRSFAVLRNYRGKEIGVGRQRRRADRILRYLGDFEDFPVIKETFNEILNMVMDIGHTKEVLSWIESGESTVDSISSDVPTPFAQKILLRGISDIISMEDKSALLREFQRKLLRKVMSEDELKRFLFEEREVAEYFGKKFSIGGKEDIIGVVRKLGALNVLSQRSRNIYDYCTGVSCRDDAEKLIVEKKLVSVKAGGIYWTVPEYLPEYAAVYAKDMEPGEDERKILDSLESGRTMRELVSAFGAGARDIIKRLEDAYLVGRGLKGGDTVYFSRNPKKADRERSLENLVYRYLEGFAPATLGEIAYALALEPEDAEAGLKPLLLEGTVEKGPFIVGDEEQYMLSRDVYALKMGKSGLGEEQIRAHRLRKFFDMDGIDDYFDLFGEASRTYDIYYHVRNFDWEDWRERRRNNGILMGKFVRGRVKYVRREDAPVFVGAFRDVSLSDFDRKVLDIIRRKDGVTAKELSTILGNSESVKNSLERLDSGCYIARKFIAGEGWQSRNIFVYTGIEPMEREKARKELIYRFLRAYGPVPLRGMSGYTGFDRSEILSYLKELESEGKAESVRVHGEADDYYITPEDRERIENEGQPHDGVRILSLFDPYTAPMWSEIASKYGEKWIYPVIKNGLLDGYAEIWPMSGRVEVREIETTDLEGALKAMEKVRDYYAAEGIDVLTVTRVRTRSVEDITDDERNAFESSGYRRVQDMMVLGNISTENFEMASVLRNMLHRQGICEKRFYDALHLIDERGWVRNDYDEFLRVRNYRPLARYRDQIIMCKVIPPLSSYTTPQMCALYRAAKKRELSEDERIVLEVIGRGRRRKDISGASPLGPRSTALAMDSLYAGSLIARDMHGFFMKIFDRAYIREPRKKVLKMLLNSYGVMSAEMLSRMTGGEFAMAEIREILKEMESGGEVVKGFFVKGDRTMYWALSESLGSMDARCTGSAVIPRDDPAGWYLEFFAKRLFGFVPVLYVVRNGELTGALRGKKRGKRIFVEEITGSSEDRYLVRDYARKWGISLDWGVEEVKDWEIRETLENYGK